MAVTLLIEKETVNPFEDGRTFQAPSPLTHDVSAGVALVASEAELRAFQADADRDAAAGCRAADPSARVNRRV